MLATVKSTPRVRRSRVEAELTKRANTKNSTGLTLSKGMSDSEIHNAMLAKLCSVREELGLI